MAVGYTGTYRAMVVDNVDPMVRNRLMVTIPDVGIESAWAEPLSGSSDGQLPAIGDEVLVQFEGGDSDRPVWNRGGSTVSTSASYGGVYRATVVNNLDPTQANRLQVEVPEVLGTDAVWATASASLGTVAELPGIAASVWVQFVGGDVSHPEWTGVQ
jgi:hypothetical protein